MGDETRKRIAELEERLQANMEDVPALDELAPLLRAEKMWMQLCIVLEKHADLATELAERAMLLLDLARIEDEQLRDVDKAIEHYARVVELDPVAPGAADALARLKRETGD